MKKKSFLKATSMLLLLSLTACTTYSVTLVHSEGYASDVVDGSQTQSPSNAMEATANIPKPIVP